MTPTIVLRHPFAEDLPWEAFAQRADVSEKVLWKRGSARAALLYLRPHASTESHRHRRSAHHVWVAGGACVLGRRHLRSGSYAYVPPGVEHSAEAGVEGCTLFYLIVPEGGAPDGGS